MAKRKMMSYFYSCICLLLQISCVKVPIEFTLNEKIELTEKEVADIAEKIYDRLAELDFAHPAGSALMVDPKECSKAYKVWLRKRFDSGLVPKALLLPSEYAASSSDPNIHQCRPLDFAKEYRNAANKTSLDEKKEARIFYLDDFRQELEENKCIDELLDPDNQKIKVNAVIVQVNTNTLTVTAPGFTLFTSDERLTPEDLEEPDAEATLLSDDTLSKLAEAQSTPAKFLGRLPTKMVDEPKARDYAEVPLVALKGSIVAIPHIFGEPDIENNYYRVPRGGVIIEVSFRFDIDLSLSDGLCAFNKFKDDIREEQKQRQKVKR